MCRWARLRWRRAAPSNDAGFTLIETMVALSIATVVFTALAYAAINAVGSTYTARINQQAIDLATQQLETVRGLTYGAIGHDAADLSGDASVSSDGGTLSYQIADGTSEGLVIVTASGVTPHTRVVQDETTNNISFEVSTYVTEPGDADNADFKRVTVAVRWTDNGKSHERLLSSLVSESTRGLPLPEFQLTPLGETTQSVNPGANAVYGFTLVNQGAPDQFNIAPSPGAGWTLYWDDGDGSYDAATDTDELLDSASDGIADTGLMDPNEEVVFWAVYAVSSAASEGDSTFTITATSSTDGTVSQSVIVTLVVVNGVITASPTPSPTSTITTSPTPTPTSPSPTVTFTTCSDTSPEADPAQQQGYTRRAYTLHNSGTTSWPTVSEPYPEPIPGSAVLDPMYFDQAPESVPSGYSLPEYSNNLLPSGTAGRILYSGGAFNGSSDSVADWRTTSTTNTTYANGMVLRLYVAVVPGEATAPISLTMQPYSYKNGTSTPLGASLSETITISSFGCSGGWQAVSLGVSFTGSTYKLNGGQSLGVQLWNSGDTKIRIAYDHEDLPGSFTVVEK